MATAYPPPPGDGSQQPQYQSPQQYPQPPQGQYGQPPQGQYPPGGYGQPQYGAPPSKNNGMAITALILGILALLLAWIPIVNFLSIVLGLAAVVLGFLGMRKAAVAGGRGLAIGGIVTGGLALLATILMIVVAAIWLNNADDEIDDWNDELDRINEQLEEDLRELEESGS